MISSGTDPCSTADIISNCQDGGIRLSGVNSDFDKPIGDRVGDVVSAVGCDKKRW